MRRRLLRPIMIAALVLVSGDFAAGGPAVAIMAAVHNCQNPDLAPESRIEACSQVIHTNLLSHGILAAVYNDRGLAHENAHDIAHARQDYDKALELKPDFAQAQANRARLAEQNPAAAAPAAPQPTEVK